MCSLVSLKKCVAKQIIKDDYCFGHETMNCKRHLKYLEIGVIGYNHQYAENVYDPSADETSNPAIQR